MATRQYIGARYVPKFYANSVDGSTAWESNVVYEPLTYVTLTNGHMYISKKEVPATVGTPASNVEYWLDVGSYNGFIDDLQQQINALVTDVNAKANMVSIAPVEDGDNTIGNYSVGDEFYRNDTLYKAKTAIAANTAFSSLVLNTDYEAAPTVSSEIKTLTDYKNAMIAYVTPEMYGAVGDGVADDTQAINDALNNGSICVCMNTYKTTTPIEIPDSKTLIVNGIIDYNGADCAIKLTNRHTKIDGIGTIQSNGNYGIKITTARHEIRNVSVSVTGNYEAAIILHSTAASTGIAYVEMENVKLYGRDSDNPYGIGVYIHTENNGYCNENTFKQAVPAYFVDAIRIYNESSNTINRNKFMHFDGEGCSRSLYAYSSSSIGIQDNYFDFRIEEFGNSARLFVDDKVVRNKFVGMGFAPKHFSVINAGAKALFTGGLGAHNIIEGWILTNSGASFGYNGSFHLNGDVVVFDANSTRDSTLALSGNEVLTRATSALWPNKIIGIPNNGTYLNLDLNYVSDWCTSPLEYIYVANPSGTTVSIINDSVTLFPATLLAQGYYKVIYNTTHNAIVLEKITLA